jgi:hypothetical protein
MKDMQAQLERLRKDAAECALIRDLATDKKKRELFTRLADHLDVLAFEVERAINEQKKHRKSPEPLLGVNLGPRSGTNNSVIPPRFDAPNSARFRASPKTGFLCYPNFPKRVCFAVRVNGPSGARLFFRLAPTFLTAFFTARAPTEAALLLGACVLYAEPSPSRARTRYMARR